MPKPGKEEYLNPHRFHCGCGYASKRPVVKRLILKHITEDHNILLASSIGGRTEGMLVCAEKGCGGKAVFKTENELWNHLSLHGLNVVIHVQDTHNY